MRVVAVIPAFNEAARIAEVVARTRPLVDAVLVVDDGSADGTADVARGAGAEVLAHEANQGKGQSLRDGLDWADGQGYEAAVALDADGQHSPEEIPRFVEAVAAADLVVGNRMSARGDMPLVRWWTNRTMSRIVSWLAGVTIPDSQVGYRLLRLAAWKQLDVKTNNFDFESEMLVSAGRQGLRLAFVPVSTVYAGETSQIHIVRDTIRFLRMVWRLWREGRRRRGADA